MSESKTSETNGCTVRGAARVVVAELVRADLVVMLHNAPRWREMREQFGDELTDAVRRELTCLVESLRDRTITVGEALTILQARSAALGAPGVLA